MNKKYCLFIGRWQPFHSGHDWLIAQKIKENKPICIAIRDTEPNEYNPLTSEQVKLMLEKVYKNMDVKVIIIPDIESVNYGRGVGYEINELEPPPGIYNISATEIRRQITAGEEGWKELISPILHDDIIRILGGDGY